VGRGQCGQPPRGGPCGHGGIAGGARLGLDVAGVERDRQDRVRHAQRGADAGDFGGFGGAFGPQAMVDRGGLDPLGKGGVGQQ